ncbi:MAG: histidine kinase [Rubrivivax sp.]|nr:histidine kinase [Rubrivivax sp.]
MITSLPLPRPRRHRIGVASALAPISPRMLGVILLLMLARAATGPLETQTELLPAVRYTALGLFHLTLMVAPILVAVAMALGLDPSMGRRRWIAIGAAVVLSPGVGVALRMLARELTGSGPPWSHFAGFAGQTWPRYALLAGVLALGLEVRRRQRRSIHEAHQAEVDQEALERELAESRLLVLRAQIEPHFLFNALASVRRLGDSDPERAAAMLASLSRYLEVALPGLRGACATLGQEFELARAYLEVQQIRMPSRLAFDFDLPAELRDREVPPLMLLTLVENAVKHGLQPSRRGGRIRVSARREGAALVLTVADTGVGFATGSGTGTGLANIRARLAAAHGAAASLDIGNNELGGVTATLRLPAR